jgi:hypothetical protein
MTALTFDFDEFCGRSDCDTTELMRVLGAVRNGAWCAGGAIRRTLIKQPLDSDFDFFFRSAEEMAEWEKKLPSTLALVRETEHHKHWKGPVEGSAIPVEIQAIRFRYYDNASDVIDSFDYTITQFALTGNTLVTTPFALWDLGRKRLAIHKVTYPVATMRRMIKYTRQGFNACAGCMATLLRETATSPEAMASLDIAYVD